MATSDGAVWAVMTYTGDAGNHLCVDAIHNGLNSVQFVALISGYADLDNNVLVKVQDNSASGAYDKVYFYYGNLGSNFGSEILSPTFTSARMITHLVGDTITVEFDTNFDGIADQTYSRSGIPTASLGTGSGLGGYVFNNVHNIQAGVPAENIVALFDAAYEYGFYN